MEDGKVQFAILTPTYNRPEILLRAILSVQKQVMDIGQNYLHIIINDSPDADYSGIEKLISTDSKIIYIKNKENLGKNASLNTALGYLRSHNFTGYIVFLDDDDWLAPNCLELFNKKINETGSKWVVSNRGYEDGTCITKNNTGQNTISYNVDYLLCRTFSGDATHAIDFAVAATCHFPLTIKNADEWVFFSAAQKQIGRFLYINTTGTYTSGYRDDGLTVAPNKIPLHKTLKEISSAHIVSPATLAYFVLRALKRLYK